MQNFSMPLMNGTFMALVNSLVHLLTLSRRKLIERYRPMPINRRSVYISSSFWFFGLFSGVIDGVDSECQDKGID